jgi:hypothetical protein
MPISVVQTFTLLCDLNRDFTRYSVLFTRENHILIETNVQLVLLNWAVQTKRSLCLWTRQQFLVIKVHKMRLYSCSVTTSCLALWSLLLNLANKWQASHGLLRSDPIVKWLQISQAARLVTQYHVACTQYMSSICRYKYIYIYNHSLSFIGPFNVWNNQKEQSLTWCLAQHMFNRVWWMDWEKKNYPANI